MAHLQLFRQLDHALEQGGGEVGAVVMRIQVVRIAAVVADELFHLGVPLSPYLVKVNLVKPVQPMPAESEEITLAIYQCRKLFSEQQRVCPR